MKGEELGGGRKKETRVGAHYFRKKVKFLLQFSLLRKAVVLHSHHYRHGYARVFMDVCAQAKTIH